MLSVNFKRVLKISSDNKVALVTFDGVGGEQDTARAK